MATIYDMAAVVTLYFICSIFLCNNSVKAGPDFIFYAGTFSDLSFNQ